MSVTSSPKKFNLPLVIGFVVVFFVLRYFLFDEKSKNDEQPNLPFTYSQIHYTKHARERMQCRDITAEEVNEVLQNGVVNYEKTEQHNEPCSTKYAVEYKVEKDKQLIRVIAAPCDNQLNIVTVIDLENNYDCNK